MHIAILTTHFYLHGCGSLKEKRGRLSGIRDKFGTFKNVAVSESNYHDKWEQAEISFVCIANEKKVIESRLGKISDYCASSVDAELTRHTIEWL